MAEKGHPDLNDVIMRQFDEMKARHPDAILLFRKPDSYETYKQDAVKASVVLDIPSTTQKIKGTEIKVVAFKDEALDYYLPKLVKAGLRVAICEQLRDPQNKEISKSTQVRTGVKSPASANNEPLNNKSTMPKKKKDEAPVQEQPKAKTEAKTEIKAEQKTEVKAEQKTEAQQERKPRAPQMITVNGDKVTHGHTFPGKDNPEDTYFVAKINGKDLKPQKMDPADAAAYNNKEMTVPQLMERYYPTKLMERVPEVAFTTPNVLTGPNGNLTIDKFNVYKEKDQTREDHGRYKFYAQVGDQKMSVVPSRQDLNAYFDRVMTPAQLVEKNFGERLHLPSHYQQFRLPEGVDAKGVHVAKDRQDGKWKVSVDLGERGSTEKKPISFDDGYALYKAKSATREQIAAKYLGNELNTLLSAPAPKMEKSASMKM